jgi:hypothetical protein
VLASYVQRCRPITQLRVITCHNSHSSSKFTCRTASIKIIHSVFIILVPLCFLPINFQHRQRPEVAVPHSNPFPLCFIRPSQRVLLRQCKNPVVIHHLAWNCSERKLQQTEDYLHCLLYRFHLEIFFQIKLFHSYTEFNENTEMNHRLSWCFKYLIQCNFSPISTSIWRG